MIVQRAHPKYVNHWAEPGARLTSCGVICRWRAGTRASERRLRSRPLPLCVRCERARAVEDAPLSYTTIHPVTWIVSHDTFDPVTGRFYNKGDTSK